VNRPRHVNRIRSMSTKHTWWSYSTSKKSKLTRVTKQEQKLMDLLTPVEVEPIKQTAGITPSSSLAVPCGRRRADISIRVRRVRSAASSLPPSSRWKSCAARDQPPPAIYAPLHSTQSQKLPHPRTASPRSGLQRAHTGFTSSRSALPRLIC
jgi:hypothetical protein